MASPQVVIGGPAVAVPKTGTLGTSGVFGIQLKDSSGITRDTWTATYPITIGATYTASSGATIVIDANGNATIQLPAGYTAAPPGQGYNYAAQASTQGPWSGTFDIVGGTAPRNLTVAVIY